MLVLPVKEASSRTFECSCCVVYYNVMAACTCVSASVFTGSFVGIACCAILNEAV